MTDLNWSTETDWDQSRDNSGVVHEAISNTDNSNAAKLKKGYSYQKPPLTTDLVGWWPLHDKVANDLSGNDNHGTLNGGVTTQVSGVGGIDAMSFDGTDDYVSIDDSSIPGGSEERTISAWAYLLGDASDEEVFYYGSWNAGEAFRVHQRSEGIGVAFHSHFYGDSSLRTGWTHFTIVIPSGASSTSDTEVYVNGSRINEQDLSGGSETLNTNKDGTAYIGYAEDLGNYFNGPITDVRIYNRALSDAEIQTLYEWGKSSNMLLGSVVRA